MSTNNWSWNDKEAGTEPKGNKLPKVTLSKSDRKKRKKARKKDLKHYSSSDVFYKSKEWRKLRYQVLRKYSAECMCCGRSKKNDGVVIHVDHVKPKSKYPKLALDFTNLQLLCEDCNLGKSNIDETDWRPALDDQEQIDAALDMDALANSPI
jgi:uncharacterized protein (TIGR02646 family)